MNTDKPKIMNNGEGRNISRTKLINIFPSLTKGGEIFSSRYTVQDKQYILVYKGY